MSADVSREVIHLTDQSTKAEVAEALGWANQSAKRQMYIVEKFTTDAPTAWSRMHAKLNAMLEDYEHAPI